MYSYTYSLAGNAYLSISANNFGKTSPENYTPVAINVASTGNGNVLMYLMSANSIETASVLDLYNRATSTVNATAVIWVLYMRTYARV